MSEGGYQPEGFELVGVLQYYLETVRREIWTGAQRRGNGNRIMSGVFWSEMINHAPHCLSGPIAISQQAIAERPEMFDLDKNCDHLYWSGGDPGDYIDASHLGGADAALWNSKISLDRVDDITGGQAVVQADIQNAINAINASPSGALIEMTGNSEPADNLEALVDRLGQAAADTDFQTRIEFP